MNNSYLSDMSPTVEENTEGTPAPEPANPLKIAVRTNVKRPRPMRAMVGLSGWEGYSELFASSAFSIFDKKKSLNRSVHLDSSDFFHTWISHLQSVCIEEGDG